LNLMPCSSRPGIGGFLRRECLESPFASAVSVANDPRLVRRYPLA
jgi:hypothetical protein